MPGASAYLKRAARSNGPRAACRVPGALSRALHDAAAPHTAKASKNLAAGGCAATHCCGKPARILRVKATRDPGSGNILDEASGNKVT